MTTTHAQRYWENFYGEGPVWHGRPNELLVREVEGLPPGSALDLGCAEGADAVWLARRGWRVTAADVSAIALHRAVAHAAEAGVDVDWQCHDLSRTFPEGSYDLVCAQYLHTPEEVPGEREAVLRRAAAAVAPGGLLLVVGHQAAPRPEDAEPEDAEPEDAKPEDGEPQDGEPGHHGGVPLPTTGDVLAVLDLDPAAWRVELEDVVDRVVTRPDGERLRFRDNVLRVRRGR